MTQQILRALLIQNRPGIHSRRHLECDAGRHVGLDQAGDDVHRRALRGQDQVDARRPRLLRQPGDQLLDLFTDDHHHVREFVDDDDDERQRRQRRMLDGLVFIEDFRRNEGRVLDRFARGDRVFYLAVIATNIAHAKGGHQAVAPIHLRDAPAQRVRCFLHVGDDRRQQVRNALVYGQLQHLRIDHDQAHLLGLRLVENTQDHRVDGNRLAGAGRAGNQQMRHARKICHD